MSVVETPPKDEAPRHQATVTRTQQVTPLMRRITFGGEGLSDFETSGSPDERVLVRFPLDPPHARSYTVRRWQPSKNELEIDFVLHGHGGAALWAATAQPGETVHLSTASGWFTPPAGCDWLLMVADHAALPAIGRILEEAPDGLPIHVIAQVPRRANSRRSRRAPTLTTDGSRNRTRCSPNWPTLPCPSARATSGVQSRPRPPDASALTCVEHGKSRQPACT